MAKQLRSSQEHPEEHSEVKVLLLKKYMEAYINILSNASTIRAIYLHDLFCGPGRYGNGKIGSPLIFLNEIIDTLKGGRVTRSATTKFHCFFNDLEEEKIEILSKEINDLNLHGYPNISVELSAEAYRDYFPKVVSQYEQLRREKGFAFVDPYGYKDIRVEDIRQLLASGNTEVLLFLPTQFMFRFSKQGTPEVLKSFMTELGLDLTQDKTGVDFINEVKEGFRRCLGERYYVDSFIIQRGKNQFFAMFFFSSHILGFEKMLDAKWKIDEDEGKGWRPPTNDLFSQTNPDGDTRKLEDLLSEYLKGDRRPNSKVYEFTLRNGFLPKHAVQVLKKWQTDNLISVQDQYGKTPKKGAFYLNYKTAKLIYIRMK